MSAFSIAFLILTTLYYILSTFAIAVFFRRKLKHSIPAEQLKISLLKPISGVDREAAENFRSYLHQDYVNFEILFGVLDPQDPCIPVILNEISGCPNASLHTGVKIDGSNNKVRILHHLYEHATGDILVITDADTRARPEFLTEITAPFEDPDVGVVTCMYRGIRAASIADALEGLHMTCIFAPGVATAHALGEIDFGLGAAIAIRRQALDKIGGFESIADYLADDFQLGRKPVQAGYRVELSHYVVEEVLGGERLRSVLARELRWSRTTKISRPAGHFGLIVTFGFTYAVAFLFASGFSTNGWSVFAGVTAIRTLTAYIGAMHLNDHDFTKRIHLLPLRDLLSFSIWVAGYFGRKVKWRGRTLKILPDGRMTTIRK